MRKLFVFLVAIFSYPLLAHEQTMSELEIKQRDEVITELTSLLLFQYQNLSQSELAARLKKHPNAVKNSNYVSVEDNYVFFGATTKFEFKNNKLIKVYW